MAFPRQTGPMPGLAAGLLAAALLPLALCACAGEGDFGRPAPSVLRDDIAPAAGSVLAWARGEPVSGFALTDDEKELRNRAWHFLMPAHPRADFDTALAELARSRILPARYASLSPGAYYAAIRADGAGSSRTPYRRLIDDITADQALLDPLAAVADRVEAADAIRAQSLRALPPSQADEASSAIARMAENKAVTDWIDRALAERVAAYRDALQRLVVETPETDAVAAERTLAPLARRVGVGVPQVDAAGRFSPS